MLRAVSGYYNGTYIVLNESVPLQKWQRVIITLALDETPVKKEVDLSYFMGRGEKMFQNNVGDYVKGLRENDRV